MIRYHYLFFIVASFFTADYCRAQKNAEIKKAGIQYSFLIDETTPISDSETGLIIPYKEFEMLTRDNPKVYHLEPVYNEYGVAAAFKLRKKTAEELRDGSIYSLNGGVRPKSGEVLPLIIAKTSDGKIYRTDSLTGKVVVLSFWISMKAPFWDEAKKNELAKVLSSFKNDANLISIGFVADEKNIVDSYLTNNTLPFEPVPDGYGFCQKFAAPFIPAFIVVDKQGKVVDYVDLQGLKNTIARAL